MSEKLPEELERWRGVAKHIYRVEMTIENLLGSLPRRDDLDFVRQAYIKRFRVTPEEAEELMDVEVDVYERTRTELALDEEAAYAFRRDDEGIYIAEGQVLGLLKAALRGLGLSRKITNVAQSFFTYPKRIRPLDPEKGEPIDEGAIKLIARPLKTRYGATLSVHECIDKCVLRFYLITTHPKVTRELMEKIIFVMGQIGFNPGARHGYGHIVQLKADRIEPEKPKKKRAKKEEEAKVEEEP